MKVTFAYSKTGNEYTVLFDGAGVGRIFPRARGWGISFYLGYVSRAMLELHTTINDDPQEAKARIRKVAKA